MVNTFMPEPSYLESLQVLDYRRLGKQRVEAKQILRALCGETKGWLNHPATKMWLGYEGSLCRYGMLACIIWEERGFKDNLLPYFTEQSRFYPDKQKPWWVGVDVFHRSHKSNLIRKDPRFYGPIWPGVPADLPYFWPVQGKS